MSARTSKPLVQKTITEKWILIRGKEGLTGHYLHLTSFVWKICKAVTGFNYLE